MRKSRPEQEPTQRQKRVNEVIRRVLSNVMISGNFFHADFTKFFVNITSVMVSPDLRQVKVYIMALNQPSETQCANILKALTNESTRLRRELSKNLTMKFVPHLKFFWDEEVEQADRIESLLRKHIPRNAGITETSDVQGEGQGEGQGQGQGQGEGQGEDSDADAIDADDAVSDVILDAVNVG